MAGVPRTGLSPATARLSRRVPLPRLLPCRPPCNPGRASTRPVWAGPLSLAATRGVTVVFLSSGYLDVSVRRVGLRTRRMPRPRAAGCPIRTPADPWLLAPPRGLSRPAASFLASGSPGIPRAPSLACRLATAPPLLAGGRPSASPWSRVVRAPPPSPRRGETPRGRRGAPWRIAAPRLPLSRRRSLSFSCCRVVARRPRPDGPGSRLFVSAFLPSCQRTTRASRGNRGECGARTRDPRLAKPVL